MNDGSVNEAGGDVQVQSALEDFGVPKSKRVSRMHVVETRTSTPRTGRETAIQNLASDEWRPTYRATRMGEKVAPMPEFLAGRDPLRVMRAARDAIGPTYDWWAK